MNRLTLGEARNRREIYRLIENGSCPTSQVVVDRINEAQERLLPKFKGGNLKGVYTFCAYDCCVTLPRELEAILAYSLDCQPAQVFNRWYEYVGSGVGMQDGNLDGIMDAGECVTFRDLCGDKKIRVYCDLNEDEDAEILVRGLDSDGNEVMTYHDSEWILGEYISLAPTYPQVSTNTFSKITSIVKPVTLGFVRLYQYDVDDAWESAIGVYAPDETLPSYHRYRIKNLCCGCDDCTSLDEGHYVKIMAKKRFVPAVNNEDDLIITSVGALKNMIISIKHEEADNIEKAALYEARAEKIMNEDIYNHRGGATPRLVITNDFKPTINIQ